MHHVKSSEELIPVFAVPPIGTHIKIVIFILSKCRTKYQLGPTPIVRVLRYVLHEKHLAIQERKLLILIATDGVPTNEMGQQDTKSLEHVLRHERKPINQIPVTIIACTDDDECIG